MRLYAKILKNFANINQFSYGTEWNIRKDEPNLLYFQLVDLDQDNLRYLPIDASFSVQVTFPALNTSGTIVKSATQTSALDRSIWSISLSATEVPFSGNVQIALTEAGIVKRFSLVGGIAVEDLNSGGC